MEPPYPPIGGIGAPLDEARFGESIDHPACGDPLDVQPVRKLGLVRSLMPRKI